LSLLGQELPSVRFGVSHCGSRIPILSFDSAAILAALSCVASPNLPSMPWITTSIVPSLRPTVTPYFVSIPPTISITHSLWIFPSRSNCTLLSFRYLLPIRALTASFFPLAFLSCLFIISWCSLFLLCYVHRLCLSTFSLFPPASRVPLSGSSVCRCQVRRASVPLFLRAARQPLVGSSGRTGDLLVLVSADSSRCVLPASRMGYP